MSFLPLNIQTLTSILHSLILIRIILNVLYSLAKVHFKTESHVIRCKEGLCVHHYSRFSSHVTADY